MLWLEKCTDKYRADVALAFIYSRMYTQGHNTYGKLPKQGYQI